jgi:hypothetical protein
MSDKDDEFEDFEAKRLLGSRLSEKYPEYLDIAKLEPHKAIAIYMLKNRKEIMKLKPIDRAIKILYYIGQVERANRLGELSILSMMIGDTSEEFDTRDEAGKDATP